MWLCCGCKKQKCATSDFSKWLGNRQNKKERDGHQKCDECMGEDKDKKVQVPRGHWSWKGCPNVLPRDEGFSMWLQPRACKTKNNGQQRCNGCVRKAKDAERAQARSNLDQVTKRARS